MARGRWNRGRPVSSTRRVSTELPDAIRRVLNGNGYVSPQFAEALSDYLGGKPTKDAHSLLSTREMQVTRLIAVGKETGEIPPSWP